MIPAEFPAVTVPPSTKAGFRRASFSVDVSGLGAHEVLHVSDIRVGEDITVITDPETAVATVATLREEPVEAAAPEAESVEPEVIGKGKKEDEE